MGRKNERRGRVKRKQRRNTHLKVGLRETATEKVNERRYGEKRLEGQKIYGKAEGY